MTDYMRTYDDWRCDSGREGEEPWDAGDMCRCCFNGQHKRCTEGSCSCFKAHSPVFHPKKTGRLILKREQ